MIRDAGSGAVALSDRLARLEDERAVATALYRLCAVVDGPSVSDWTACFTADGTFSWSPGRDAALALDLRGSDALAEWFARHRTINPVGTQLHLIHHPVIEIDGDEARAVTTYATIRAQSGDLPVASTGVYHDRLVRCSQGRWKVAAHHAVGAMSRSQA